MNLRKIICRCLPTLAALLPTLAPAQPAAPSVPASDTYFGTKVDDPYRNLENLKDPAVLAWMKAQSEYARRTLDAIPGRQKLLDAMTACDARQTSRAWNVRVTDNGRYFYLKTRPQDQQPKLYCRDGYQGPEVLLVDPEHLEKGKAFTINGYSPSYDGSKVAYVLSEHGAELGTMYVLNVATRKPYPERLDYLVFGDAVWLPDNTGFTYTPLNNGDLNDPAARLNTVNYLHRVGQPASHDRPVFSGQLYPELHVDPSMYPVILVDRDTRLAYGGLFSVDRYLHLYQAPAAALAAGTHIRWKPLFGPAQQVTNYVTDAQYIYFTTSLNTPRQKIMRMPVAHPNAATAEVLVPESPDEALEDQQLKITKDGLYFVRTRNGVAARLYFLPNGDRTPREIKLPLTAGTIRLESRDCRSADLWVSAAGWATPSRRFHYTAAAGHLTPEPLSTEIQYPEFADLVVEEVLVPSHDGVPVPLSLVYKKGTPRDGTVPVYMEGYGAYSKSRSPYFFPPFLLWTQQGGIFAVAHVRGGGELGEAWHQAGQKATKPNTWKDLIASAEYLVKNHYTGPGKIAINGGSAGGILIGRAMTERPDLFAVAMPEVGILNAVRFENSANGPDNIPEFGTMAKPDEAKALLEMDAYLHLTPGTKYPATLVTAGFNDPRVIAWQPAKFAARLQASSTSGKPVLFFTNYAAGHGIGDSKQQEFAAVADLLAFALWQTGAPAFQPQPATK